MMGICEQTARAACVVGLAAGGLAHSPAHGQVLLDLDFRATSPEASWQVLGDDTADWDGKEGRVTLRDGDFDGPRITQMPEGGDWARLTIRARSEADQHCAVIYFDAQGDQLMADQYELLSASEELTDHVFCFRPHADAASMMVRIRSGKHHSGSIAVEAMRVEAVSRAQARKWADQMYSRVPPLPQPPQPQEGFWDLLPRTKQAIEQGQALRVVFLGDSIANDTSTSPIEVLIEAAHPGLRMSIVPSVRSGTGCPYYREDNRVQEFVTRYEPDLVIVMGISHKMDLEAIRDVAGQIREQTQAEVLLMPGAVSTVPGKRGSPGRARHEQFREDLAQLAQELDAAHYDLRAAWEGYLEQTGADIDSLRRDPVHANTLGRQILARIMSRVLDPTGHPARPPK